MQPESQYLQLAIEAAEAACKLIMEVYTSADFETKLKDDNSPLTIADQRSHDCIESFLAKTNLPILSEEGKDIPYEERGQWNYFWLVDPLDGTKEFIKRNGEFTVNIALVKGTVPVMGVVAIPATGEVFYGSQGAGAFRKHQVRVERLARRAHADLKSAGLRVVASRSHMDADTEAFITGLEKPSLVNAGSSLKFLLLATGKADVYPRFAPTMEWDTGAAQAILDEVGLNVYVQNAANSEILSYNKLNLRNPGFLVF